MWQKVNKGNPYAIELADRHYNRQSKGSLHILPPGKSLVLITEGAVWACIYQKHPKHGFLNYVNNCLFRNEGIQLSSDLIREATKLTMEYFYEAEGMITFVNPKAIKSSNPGFCYKVAGWKKIGTTKRRNYIILKAPYIFRGYKEIAKESSIKLIRKSK